MWANATAPYAAMVDPNFGVCLASAPQCFADLHPIPTCSASGNNMRLVNAQWFLCWFWRLAYIALCQLAKTTRLASIG